MKKRSFKFWIIFWTISVVFLFGLYFTLQFRKGGMDQMIDYLPIGQENKAIATLAEYLYRKDDVEKTFLILFQNNMEIRPGGGFIGAFGVVKVKNGQVTLLQTHDLSNFDARIPDTVSPPYPMQETLRIRSWKLRDSNYSPDFAVNAKKAEEFYKMGQGQENFDGVIGITTNVLTSFLKITGPIQVEGYPGTYADENAIMALEYQVEKAYVDQNIPVGERKSIIGGIAQEVMKKVFALSSAQKLDLYNIITEDLNKKDVQLFFKDQSVKDTVQKANWGGLLDSAWKKDFLMTVDANLGAYKSDYFVKRSLDYTIDLSGEIPKAILRITYKHTAEKKDWMTKDYLTYLRVYVPTGAWLTDAQNFPNPQFSSELGRTTFGSIVKVPLGQTKTVEINYTLPKEISADYNLKIQKQAGINDEPIAVHVFKSDGTKKDYTNVLNSDFVLLAE